MKNEPGNTFTKDDLLKLGLSEAELWARVNPKTGEEELLISLDGLQKLCFLAPDKDKARQLLAVARRAVAESRRTQEEVGHE